MTADEIRAMPAGRELDVLVGIHVTRVYVADRESSLLQMARDGTFDWKTYTDCGEERTTHIGPAFYSTDIAAAWEVAEKFAIGVTPIKDGGYLAMVRRRPDVTLGEVWMSPWFWQSGVHLCPYALGDTAPEAICRCALLAKLTEAPCPDPSPR